MAIRRWQIKPLSKGQNHLAAHIVAGASLGVALQKICTGERYQLLALCSTLYRKPVHEPSKGVEIEPSIAGFYNLPRDNESLRSEDSTNEAMDKPFLGRRLQHQRPNLQEHVALRLHPTDRPVVRYPL